MLTIAFLFALWIVIKATFKVVEQYKHLSDEEVRDVMLNRINKHGKEYSRIIRHLGLCEDCQEKLHSFKDDDFLEDHLIEGDDT